MANRIEIPIKVKNYSGYTVEYIYRPYRPNKDIIFPASIICEGRMVEIGTFKINDYDHSSLFVKEGQRLEVDPPFCFNANRANTVIELTPESFNSMTPSPQEDIKGVPVYMCIDCIKELHNQINLEQDYRFTFKWIEYSSSPNSKEEKIAEEQFIKPYLALAELGVIFSPQENCKNSVQLNEYRVFYSQADTHNHRLHLGDIIIRNKQTIPYKYPNGDYECILMPDVSVDLYSWDGRRRMTVGGYISNADLFVNSASVIIPNGGEDVSFPVLLDWEQWEKADCPETIFLEVVSHINGVKSQLLSCLFSMTPQYYDGVYALDLGTSGIVVAKQNDGNIKLLELKDQDNENLRIEDNPYILSSISILKKQDGSIRAELAPQITDIYQERNKVIVPIKFIVGQNKIPFIDYNDNAFCMDSVYAFGVESSLDMSLSDNQAENELKIKTFVGQLYSDVLGRLGETPDKINKIIVTYPNTYTSEILNEVKSILCDNLGLNKVGQISFVPESDAVAAFYFNQRIFNGGFPKKSERVVIYDMGAGTLDLSLVEFCMEDDGHHIVKILNKIGAPIAGNFLDYTIYKGFEKYISAEGKKYTGQLYIKEAIANFKKSIPAINNDTKVTSLAGFDNLSESYLKLDLRDKIKNSTYHELLGKDFDSFLAFCSTTVMKALLDGYGDNLDTIVFSGRASQFVPLKNAVLNEARRLNSDIKEDKIWGQADESGLKVCVAEGALKYMDLFDENSPHEIENKNQYAKIAIVYWGETSPGQYTVQIRWLLQPNEEDWHDAERVNGTICKAFHKRVTLDKVINGTRVYYVQTYLWEDELKELFKSKYATNDDSNQVNLNWGLVNILYESIIRTANQQVDVELEITTENVITKRRIGANELRDSKIVENVENNALYRLSMWPNVK